MKSSNSLNDDAQNESASSAENDTEESKLSPIGRFRRLARSVQSQGWWTKALQTKIADEHTKEFHINQKSGQTDVILSFNVNGEQMFLFYCIL